MDNREQVDYSDFACSESSPGTHQEYITSSAYSPEHDHDHPSHHDRYSSSSSSSSSSRGGPSTTTTTTSSNSSLDQHNNRRPRSRSHSYHYHDPPSSSGRGSYVSSFPKGPKRVFAKGPEVERIADFFETCTSRLLTGSAQIELDARLGKLDGAYRYLNGVKLDDYDRLDDFLLEDGKRDTSRHSELKTEDITDYIFRQEDGGKLRITYANTEGNPCQTAYIEKRLEPLHLPTSQSLHYDCIVSAVSKEPAQRISFDQLPPNCEKKKQRKSSSFYKERNIWLIELSEINIWRRKSIAASESQATDGMGEALSSAESDAEEWVPHPENPIYEVRFQIMPDVLESMSNSQRHKLEDIASRFFQQIEFFSRKMRSNGPFLFNRYSPESPRSQRRSYLSHRSSSFRSSSTHTRGQSSLADGASCRAHSSRSPSPSPLSPGGPSSLHTTPALATSPVDSHVYTFADIQMTSVDSYTSEQMKRQVVRLVKYSEDDGPAPNDNLAFPGALPIHFGRRHWKTIQTNDYYISEKTDGIRYMLYITGAGLFFIDRSFRFYRVGNFDHLIHLYSSSGPTLLDGEMVRHRTTDRPTFLVFDCIAINGVNYCKENLNERLGQIRERIVAPYRSSVEEGAIDSTHPFVIIGKQFYPKKFTSKMFEHIRKEKTETGDVDYYYHDPKRYHRTDGIIFTPNSAYSPHTNNMLFKWKYSDKCSIDFKLIPSETEEGLYSLTCRGNSQQGDIYCDTTQFSSRDVKRLKDDLALQRARRNCIVECVYDLNLGLWRYLGLRTDKNVANFSKTVFNTLLCAAEKITKEEILYRIVKNSKTDDWNARRGISTSPPSPPALSVPSRTTRERESARTVPSKERDHLVEPVVTEQKGRDRERVERERAERERGRAERERAERERAERERERAERERERAEQERVERERAERERERLRDRERERRVECERGRRERHRETELTSRKSEERRGERVKERPKGRTAERERSRESGRPESEGKRKHSYSSSTTSTRDSMTSLSVEIAASPGSKRGEKIPFSFRKKRKGDAVRDSHYISPNRRAHKLPRSEERSPTTPERNNRPHQTRARLLENEIVAEIGQIDSFLLEEGQPADESARRTQRDDMESDSGSDSGSESESEESESESESCNDNDGSILAEEYEIIDADDAELDTH